MSYSIGRTALKEFDINRAVYGKFDGSTNYVSVPDNVNLNFGTGGYSLEIFFKTGNDISYFQSLLNKGVQGTGNKWFNLRINSSRLYVYVGDASGTYWCNDLGNYTILANTFYHIIISFNRTGTQDFYLNGVRIDYTTTTNIVDITNSSAFEIGAQGANYWVTSKIYLTRLHNRALSASEVLAYYNNGRPDLYQIPYSDRWGSQTNLVDNATDWTDSNSDGLANNWNKYTNNTASIITGNGFTGNAQRIDKSTDTNLGLYRIISIPQGRYVTLRFKYRSDGAISSGTASATYSFTANIGNAIQASASFITTGAWSTFIIFCNGTYIEIDDVELVYSGVVADYRFNEGSGYQIKDYSANKLHGTLNGTYDGFWQSNKQFFTAELTFLHSAISSTAATTTLFKLPANVKIKELITDPTVAFDTDNTISLGISGNETWLAALTGTNATTPQYANVDKMYSPNNEVQLYIKKAGASTTGSITLKFRFENMSYKGSTNCNPIL